MLLYELRRYIVFSPRLSTKEAPCIEGENYKEDKKYHGTMLECMEREFTEREGCYMPWQTGSAKTKVCDIVKYDAFMGELRSTPTVEKFVELTGCLHSCESIVRKMVQLW